MPKNPENAIEYEETKPTEHGFFAEIKDSNACSVRVAVRVRPLINRETVLGENNLCLDVKSDRALTIADRNFEFDKVFALQSKQQYLFDSCARNLVLGCFHGFNATLIAYGQTGSGKTHTMGTGSTLGIKEDQIGIVPRVFNFIFSETEKRQSLGNFTVKCSFLELYNEEFHDLLDPKSFGG